MGKMLVEMSLFMCEKVVGGLGGETLRKASLIAVPCQIPLYFHTSQMKAGKTCM